MAASRQQAAALKKANAALSRKSAKKAKAGRKGAAVTNSKK